MIQKQLFIIDLKVKRRKKEEEKIEQVGLPPKKKAIKEICMKMHFFGNPPAPGNCQAIDYSIVSYYLSIICYLEWNKDKIG